MVFNLMSLSHPYVDPLYPSCQKIVKMDSDNNNLE